jgi:dTDP-glucose pyrophosphorylase
VLRRTNCVVMDKDQRIVHAIEKPVKPTSGWRGIGIYVFDQLIFSYIRNTPTSSLRNEREITDTLRIMSSVENVYGHPIGGANWNINTLRDLLDANQAILGAECMRASRSKRLRIHKRDPRSLTAVRFHADQVAMSDSTTGSTCSARR